MKYILLSIVVAKVRFPAMSIQFSFISCSSISELEFLYSLLVLCSQMGKDSGSQRVVYLVLR